MLSCTSARMLEMLENLEVDAGITYLNNEPLGRVRTVPLYTERYRFITQRGARFADRAEVTWAELGDVQLCLLTPDMQNRRIMDRLMRGAGVEPRAALESNSQITLLAHVLTGHWATVLPEHVAETLALSPAPALHRDHRAGGDLPDRARRCRSASRCRCCRPRCWPRRATGPESRLIGVCYRSTGSRP